MKNLIALILIAVAILGFFLYVRPAYSDTDVLRAEAARYEKALEQSRELMALRDTLLNRYNSFSSADLARLEKMLPETVDTVRLILDVDGIAAKHSMVLENLSVSEPTIVDDGGNPEPTRASIKLSFSVEARYEEFKDFLMDLEDSLRIVDVRELSFSSTQQGDTSSYAVTIETYWLR